jgi:2-methylcitrate dehydratase
MRDRFRLEEIDHIDVETYWLAYSENGSEPAKWDPQTRETADHSIPYLVAAALIDGKVDPDTYTAERISDPRLRPLMNRIRVVELPEFTQRFPRQFMCRISVALETGERITDELAYPRGHASQPFTDAEIELKFETLLNGRADAEIALCQRVRKMLWQLEAIEDVSTLIEPLGELNSV